MFRLLQIMDILLIFPMVILGLIVGLSGGGSNQWNRWWSKIVFRLAPMGIVGALIAEIIWRFNIESIAYAVVLAPLVIWFGLLVLLQKKTHFFFQQKKRRK